MAFPASIPAHPQAVFRFDASPRIGSGHAMRCLVLAESLAQAGWRCGFACGAGSLDVVPALRRIEGDHVTLDGDEAGEAAALARHWPAGCDLLVVDHYRRDAAFETACRPWTGRVMAIDDLADRRHDCEILLDQTYGRRAADYDGLVPAGCDRLVGSRYALLRPAFAAARPAALARRRSPGPVRRIQVALGGTDPGNVTAVVLDGLAAAAGEAEVDVVMGAAAPHLAAIREKAERLGRRVTVHAGVGNMADLTAAADIAIGAAGTSAWERCCLGLPTLLVVLADNQRLVAAALEKAGAARRLGLGSEITPQAVGAAVEDLCRSDEARRAMGKAAAGLCDGDGLRRVMVGLLPPLPGRDGGAITLRLATAADAARMLAWQSDPQTRRHARNPRPPEAGEHERWLAGYLGETGGILTIILDDGTPAGVLRFDRVEEGWEISILVAPERYRHGVGRAALSLARNLFPDEDLLAEVLPGNAASHALFRGAGFRPFRDGLYINRPTVGEVCHAC